MFGKMKSGCENFQHIRELTQTGNKLATDEYIGNRYLNANYNYSRRIVKFVKVRIKFKIQIKFLIHKSQFEFANSKIKIRNFTSAFSADVKHCPSAQ